MKELDQQIAIAKFCGWKKCKGDCFQGQFERKDEPGFVFDLHHIPDYLHDLNAMHEVEMLLDDRSHGGTLSRYDQYADELSHRFGRGLRATASQRAEALLRTIGKWK